MRTTMPAFLLLIGLLAGTSAAQDDASGISILKVVAEDPNRSDSEREQEILRKLIQTDVDLTFVESPLKEVTQLLSHQIDVPIRIQERALQDVGLTSEFPVTFDLKGVRAQTFLRRMLRKLDLTYSIEPAGIVITSAGEAEEHLPARFYPLKDLLYAEPVEPGSQPDYDSIIEVILTTIKPDSWSEGKPHLGPIGDGLVIPQMQFVHELIAGLLDAVRQAKSLPADAYRTEPILVHPLAQRTQQFRQRLHQTTISLELHKTPLSEVAKSLSGPDIQVLLDERALDDVGLDLDIPITLHEQDVSLAFALDQLVDPYDLAWYSVDRIVIISTPAEQETELETRVYPVRDILWRGLDVSDAKLREAISQQPFSGFRGRFGRSWQTINTSLALPHFNDYDTLIDALTTVEESSWSRVGGPGNIAPFPQAGCLVITQTEHVHEKLITLLAEIRRHQKPLDPEIVRKELNAASDHIVVVAYDAIVGKSDAPRLSREDLTRISVRVKKLVAADSWDEDEHFIDVTEQGLIVRQTSKVQREIVDFLFPLGLLIKSNSTIIPSEGGLQGGISASKVDQQPAGSNASQSTTPMNNQGGFF